MRQKRARAALRWFSPLIVSALGGAAILMSAGCGGSDSGDDGLSDGAITVNATFAPSTSKDVAGYIGSVQVTVKNSAGEVQGGSPFCLTRSATSGSTNVLPGGTGYVVEMRGYRSTNCSGDVIATANVSATVDGDTTVNLSAQLTSLIDRVEVEPQAIAPFDAGDTAQFTATAFVGSSVVMTSAQDSSFVWSVSPSTLGTITPDGLFTAAALASNTAGTVVASLGGVSGSSAISVNANAGTFRFKVQWGAVEYIRAVAGYVNGIGVVLTNNTTGLALPAFFARPATLNATEQEYFMGNGSDIPAGNYTLQVEGFTGNSDLARGNSLGIVTIGDTVPQDDIPVISDRLDANVAKIQIYADGDPVNAGDTIQTFIGDTVELDAAALDSNGNFLFSETYIQFTSPGGGVLTLNDPGLSLQGIGLGTTTLTAKAGVATGPSSTVNVTVGPGYVVAYQFFDGSPVFCQNIRVVTSRTGEPPAFQDVCDIGNVGNYSDSVNYPNGFGFGNLADFQVIEPSLSADGQTLAFVVDVMMANRSGFGAAPLYAGACPNYGKDIVTIDVVYDSIGRVVGLVNSRRQTQPNDGFEDRMPTFNPKLEGGKLMIYWSSMNFNQAITAFNGFSVEFGALWNGTGGIDGAGWPSVRKIFKKGKLDNEATRIGVTGGTISTGGAEGNHFWPAINPDGTVLTFIQKVPNSAFLRVNDHSGNSWPRTNSAVSPFWLGRTPEREFATPIDGSNSTGPAGPYTNDAGLDDPAARYPGQIILFDLATGSTATSPEVNINQQFRLSWRPTRNELFAVRNIIGNDRIDALENAVIGSPLNVFRQTQTGVVAPFAAIIANPLIAGFVPEETLAYREPSGQIKFRTELDTPNLIGNNYPNVGIGTNTVFPVPNR